MPLIDAFGRLLHLGQQVVVIRRHAVQFDGHAPDQLDVTIDGLDERLRALRRQEILNRSSTTVLSLGPWMGREFMERFFAFGRYAAPQRIEPADQWAILMHAAPLPAQEYTGALFNAPERCSVGLRIAREKFRRRDPAIHGKPVHFIRIETNDLVVATPAACVTGIRKGAVAPIDGIHRPDDDTILHGIHGFLILPFHGRSLRLPQAFNAASFELRVS